MSAKKPGFSALEDVQRVLGTQREFYISARRCAVEVAWRLMFDWADVWDEGPLLAVPPHLWPTIVSGKVGEPIPIWHLLELMMHTPVDPRPGENSLDGFFLIPYAWIQGGREEALLDWVTMLPHERPKEEPSVLRHDWTIFVRRFRRNGKTSWGLLLELPLALRPVRKRLMGSLSGGLGGGYKDQGTYVWFEDNLGDVKKLIRGVQEFLLARKPVEFPKRPFSSPGGTDMKAVFLAPSE